MIPRPSMPQMPRMGATMPQMPGLGGAPRIPGASDAFGNIGASADVRALAPAPTQEDIDPSTIDEYSPWGRMPEADSYKNAYSDAIMQAMIERTTAPDWTEQWRWTDKSRKYADRHADYLSQMADKIGKPLTKIEVPRGYEQNAYVVTDADGKRYIVDTPHSPGGLYSDISLGPNAIGLGLGDLGGSGQYKNLPSGAGASYLPWEAYRGDKPEIVEAKDINVKKSGGFLGDLGFIADIAAMIPGPWQIPAQIISGANALDAGNVGSALMSFAGAGGFTPTKIGNLVGFTDPTWARVAGSAISGGIRGADRGDILGGAVRGGLSSYATPLLQESMPKGWDWLAAPIVQGGLQMASGAPIDLRSIGMASIPGLLAPHNPYQPRSSTAAPRQALIKGTK